MAAQPLAEEITLAAPLADVFAAFLTAADPVFLDSSLRHDHLGRYSYITADPVVTISSKNGHGVVRTRRAGLPLIAGGDGLATAASRDFEGDPFAELQGLLRARRTARLPGLPPFQGGALGYFGYDLGQHVEVLPRRALDDVGVPDIYVGLYEWVLAHDHLHDRSWLIANPRDVNPHTGKRLLELLKERLAEARTSRPTLPTTMPASSRTDGRDATPVRPAASFSREGYLRAIVRAKEYIAAGDIYQVCLSQRFSVPLEEHPWILYRRLRSVSPVPYGAYLGFRDAAVASASPELFLRLEDSRVETRPIKGTRPRGATPDEDAALVADLCRSEKDRAENLMIVDLLRNDIGRVCRIGSVRVPELFTLESYSTVHHLVSAVEGELRPAVDAVDLLRACFPGGSVTGCPKIRAMEIIDELEPTRRGIYCGAIGFIGFDGDMDTSIVIRTVVVKDGVAYFQVGGAIVADSDPAAEYQETLDKAQAAMLALGQGTARSEEKELDPTLRTNDRGTHRVPASAIVSG